MPVHGLQGKDIDHDTALETALSRAKLEVGDFNKSQYALAPNGQLISLTGNVSDLISTAAGEGIPQRGGKVGALHRETQIRLRLFSSTTELLLAFAPVYNLYCPCCITCRFGTAMTGSLSRARPTRAICTDWSLRDTLWWTHGSSLRIAWVR